MRSAVNVESVVLTLEALYPGQLEVLVARGRTEGEYVFAIADASCGNGAAEPRLKHAASARTNRENILAPVCSLPES